MAKTLLNVLSVGVLHCAWDLGQLQKLIDPIMDLSTRCLFMKTFHIIDTLEPCRRPARESEACTLSTLNVALGIRRKGKERWVGDLVACSVIELT